MRTSQSKSTDSHLLIGTRGRSLVERNATERSMSISPCPYLGSDLVRAFIWKENAWPEHTRSVYSQFFKPACQFNTTVMGCGFLRRSVDKELLSVGGHIPDKNIAGKSTEGRVEEPSRMPVLSDVPVVASTAITVRSFTT
jgi:hypothetical protein